MRRPQIGKRLGLPAGAKGLSDLVSGAAPLEACVHRLAESALWVMPVGHLPPNPLELLLSQRFRDTLAALGRQFEVIVIDSPPVELVSDALVIGPLASGVIYVVKAMRTPHPLARKGIARLQRGGAKMLGVVLNHLDFARARKYYGDQSGQGRYGGEYGYGADGVSATEFSEPADPRDADFDRVADTAFDPGQDAPPLSASEFAEPSKRRVAST
jgi:capsular exopolysaccharide synthesis family protein